MVIEGVSPWPAPGTRVAVRYRLPAGSVPPLTDVVGHLVESESRIVVRPKSGEDVVVDADDVLSVRPLPGAPVRNPDIRRLEHAAALAWPGTEQSWVQGWLLRTGGGYTARANSAVPLGVEATLDAAEAIVEFYGRRGLPPILACPDRLVRLPAAIATDRENLVMTSDVTADLPDDSETVVLASPSGDWLRLYERDVPAEVLTAVIDGVVGFGIRNGAAVGRAAVTAAPNGVKWVGLSAVHVTEAARRGGQARALCTALLAWGARHGATRAYIQVLDHNTAAIALYESMGFALHHRTRYADARSLLGRRL